MSTIFVVHKTKKKLDLLYDSIKSKDINDDLIEIAFRSSNGCRFTNPIAHLLDDDLEVYPLDNSAQGIYTIKDIKDNLHE